MKPLSRMISAIKESFHNDYGEQDHLINQQTQILHHGIEATAEVIDVQVNLKHGGHLVTLKLWIKLNKSDGSASYFHALSLMPVNRIPKKGDLLHIRYLPENRAVILVL